MLTPLIRAICLIIVLLMTQTPLVADPAGSARVFPNVTAPSLNGKSLTFPRDFETGLNLCLIAFQREQQKDLDTWVSGTAPIIQPAGVSCYVFPVIRRMPALIRDFINGGMRQGIRDSAARDHTVTLYIDKTPFRQSLGLGSENVTYAVLVDRNGLVLWSGAGDYTPEAGASLQKAIIEHQPEAASH